MNDEIKAAAEEILRIVKEVDHAYDWTKGRNVSTKILNIAGKAQEPKMIANNMRMRDLALSIAWKIGLHHDNHTPTSRVIETAYFINLPAQQERMCVKIQLEEDEENNGKEQ